MSDDPETTEGTEQAPVPFTDWFAGELARIDGPDEGDPPAAIQNDDEPEATEETDDTGEEEPQAAAGETEDDQSEDDTDGPESDTEAQLVTVRLNGKDEEISLDELVKGYHRQSDYTRKTMELAEQRKQFDAQRQAFAAQQQQQTQNLSQIRDQMAKQAGVLDGEEIQKLHDEGDYQEWSIQKARRDAFDKQFDDQAKAQQADVQKLQAEAITDCWKKVPELVPEWADLEAAKPEINDVARYLVGQGVPEAQVVNIVEPLVWPIARKAMLYDRLQQKKPAVEKKVAAAPRISRPGTARTTKASQAEKEKKAADRLKKSGEGLADYLLASGIV